MVPKKVSTNICGITAFFFGCEACEILVPRPRMEPRYWTAREFPSELFWGCLSVWSAGSFLTGIEPVPSSVEAWTPSHWTTGKSLTEGLEKKTWESFKYRQKVYNRSAEHALFPSPTKIPAMSQSFLPFNLT